MRALRLILVASSLVTWQISASPDAHFLRSLKSNSDTVASADSSDPSIRTLRSGHFLRALRALGAKDLQRILRSDPNFEDKSEAEEEEFARGLRTNGDHFLRSLRSGNSNSGHFLRSLKSAHDFMRMVRSDGHFLRSLRDVNGNGNEDFQ